MLKRIPEKIHSHLDATPQQAHDMQGIECKAQLEQ